jgi:hypothetical protein
MKIALIVEGQTEKAFVPFLRSFLRSRLPDSMPNIDPLPYDGRIPTGEKLQRVVIRLLSGPRAADHVVALTDVYTGARPPEFQDATDAKAKMRQWVGAEPRFHPHAAQYDFEAWLLPYWPSIQRLACHNRACPPGNPEEVNHANPPAHRIRDIFETGRCRDSYIKPRDAGRILRENDLSVAVSRCSELKALVNTILGVCGGEAVR